MKTWQEYKNTFPKTPDLFDLARSGDLLGLRDIITDHYNLDLDQRNSAGFSALMLAVYNGQRDFCEALLRSGVNVESADNMNNTVLMAASFKGNIDIIKLLLQFGADPHRLNATSMNAYDWALMFGRKDVTEFYSQKGFYKDIKSSKYKSIWRFLLLGPTVLKNKILK